VRITDGKYEGKTGIVVRLTAQKAEIELDDALPENVMVYQRQLALTVVNMTPEPPTPAAQASPHLSIGARVVVEGGKYDGRAGKIQRLTAQKADVVLDSDGAGSRHPVQIYQKQLKLSARRDIFL
jgi:ribosomal protein L24